MMNKVGVSGATKAKQQALAKIIAAHLRIVQSIFKRYGGLDWLEPKYLYFDLNAGPGIWGKEQLFGSPLIFLNQVMSLPTVLQYSAKFVEKDANVAQQLKRNIYEYFPRSSSTIYEYSNTDFINDLVDEYGYEKKKRFGILYSDPNGLPPFKQIVSFSEVNALSTIDILIHLPAVAIKRGKGLSGKKRLFEWLEAINRKHWQIQQPDGIWQWTFLLGTNWKNFPKFKKLGFRDIETSEGGAILDKLNLTRKEKEDHFIHSIAKEIKECYACQCKK